MQILGESCASLLRAAFEGRPLRGLDVGCGDQQVSRTIAACLPNSRWRACDLYDLPTALEKDPAWGNYRQMADGVLPFADKTFDVVMFCDVLHHVEREKQADLIQEAVRIGNYLLIKDHFALDAYANIMLRLMDLVGNAPYNVRVLATYFTPDRFDALLGVLKLERVSRLHGIDLYRHLPVLQWLISPQWQFIDLLKAPD
ncbi:MAG: methyltransferase domain-containing protein [Gammaproteobacteria bacterium]|nr:methyltransferase domain-containing protein [Gammaproteobacteria bacterium]MCP5195493.1 methyltransferase domain-containing protein [Gammaproteobacteria bacterium]